MYNCFIIRVLIMVCTVCLFLCVWEGGRERWLMRIRWIKYQQSLINVLSGCWFLLHLQRLVSKNKLDKLCLINTGNNKHDSFKRFKRVLLQMLKNSSKIQMYFYFFYLKLNAKTLILYNWYLPSIFKARILWSFYI